MVENLLEHGNHKLRGQDVMVCRAPVEESVEEEEEMKIEETEADTATATTETNAILVEGLGPNTDQEVLELFFENTKRSGGGEIQNIKMYQKSGRAIIWFTKADCEYCIAYRFVRNC